MELFDHDAVEFVNELSMRAMEGIEAAIGRTGIDACVTGGGSMFRVHLKKRPPRNYREAFADNREKAQLKVLLDHLQDAGFIMINTCSATISTPMGTDEIDPLVDAMESGFTKLSH
jgi:glutamate-1-semialdehyde 2,1-aminomutase